jgi:hypothetical protein
MTGSKIRYFDPFESFSQNPLVLEDGVHGVRNVGRDHQFIAYETFCGKMFLLPITGEPIEEAELDYLPEVNCRRCKRALV